MIDSLTEDIEKRINKFLESLPEVERKIYASLLTDLKELSLYSDGTIKNNLENIKKLGRLKKNMDDIVLNDAYLKDVSRFIDIYSAVEKTANTYFGKLSSDFTPKKVLAEVKKQAINDAVEMLTENGISANVSVPLRDLIKTNITSGGSYATLTEQLREALLSTPDADGKLVKYARTYTTDAVNTYSGTYMKIITDDLGLKWFRFTGSIIKTSREICKEMVKKSYIHVSEFTDMFHGKVNGKQLPLGKNGFPYGMKPTTTVDNYQELRNGFQCAHQLIPISEVAVPKDIRIKVYDAKGIRYDNDGFAIGK